MTLQESSAFFEDIKAVLQKHGISAISCSNTSKLIEDTKHLEGFHLFFTKGEKRVHPNPFEESPKVPVVTTKPTSFVVMKKSKFNDGD